MAEKLPNQLKLEIVVPDRLLFSGSVDAVTVPGAAGYMGILPGHAPLLSELQVGVITYRQGNRITRLYCDWGFVEVLPDQVSILVEAAEESQEIDEGRARADKERAESMLRSKEVTDYQDAINLWKMAVARLEVKGTEGR